MSEFPFIEVAGGPFEMGYQHGKQAESLIRKYLAWIVKFTGMDLNRLRPNAMRFLPYIQRLSPAYVQEVHGLAEGARISLPDAMLCQARAEASKHWDGGCTAFALTRGATADGGAIAGQNQDLELEYSDVAIVLRVRPNDGRPAAVMLTFAGQLGYAGMNQFGVCNFVNALYNFEWKPGLPYYPLRRALLEERTVENCLKLLRQNRACSAANLVMADGKGDVADVESRPEGIVLYEDRNPNARLHTNHYLTKDFAPFEDGTLPDSVPRLERARELVRQSWGKITVDTMKALMADHEGGNGAICRHGAANLHSIAGYIAEPAKGLFHVRRGYGCKGAWKAYRV
jgi:Acyl-coenzyme A:6-aminopenicillanic acid acyl-transferase